MYNKIRIEITSYVKLAFPDVLSEMEEQRTLDAFIEKWEAFYSTEHINILQSELDYNDCHTDNDITYKKQHFVLSKVLTGIENELDSSELLIMF